MAVIPGFVKQKSKNQDFWVTLATWHKNANLPRERQRRRRTIMMTMMTKMKEEEEEDAVARKEEREEK